MSERDPEDLPKDDTPLSGHESVPDDPSELVEVIEGQIVEPDDVDYLLDIEVICPRLPGESERLYHWFIDYSALPFPERTSRKVGERFGVHPSTVRKARSKFNWNERSRRLEVAKHRSQAVITDTALRGAAQSFASTLDIVAAKALKAAENADFNGINVQGLTYLVATLNTALNGRDARVDELPQAQALEAAASVVQDDRPVKMLRSLADDPDLLEALAATIAETPDDEAQ